MKNGDINGKTGFATYAKLHGHTKKETLEIMDLFCEFMKDNIINNGSCSWRGLGTFKVSEHRPQGIKVKYVKFIQGKHFKNLLKIKG